VTIEQERERIDIQDIKEMSAAGIETGVTEDRSETAGGRRKSDQLEGSAICLMIERAVDEVVEIATQFKEAVVIEKRVPLHHPRKRSLLRT
jgi:hypothetical protein